MCREKELVNCLKKHLFQRCEIIFQLYSYIQKSTKKSCIAKALIFLISFFFFQALLDEILVDTIVDQCMLFFFFQEEK